MPTLSRRQLAWHRMITAQTAFMVARTLVNPQVYVAVGLDPREARRAALANPHYRETMAWMGERVVGFLDEQGLIGPAAAARLEALAADAVLAAAGLSWPGPGCGSAGRSAPRCRGPGDAARRARGRTRAARWR